MLNLDQLISIEHKRRTEEFSELNGEAKTQAMKKLILDETGIDLNLQGLLGLLSVEEYRQDVIELDTDTDLWTPYTYAIGRLLEEKNSEKRINGMMDQGILRNGWDLDSLQYNTAKIFLQDDENMNIYLNDYNENLDFYHNPLADLKYLLQKIYDIKGTPENMADLAEILIDVPPEHYGLTPESMKHLKARIYKTVILEDHDPTQSEKFKRNSLFRRLLDISSTVKKIKQKQKHYSEAFSSFNSSSRIHQTKLATLEDLPLSLCFHNGFLYGLMYDEKMKTKLVGYDSDFQKIGELAFDNLQFPVSIAGHGKKLIIVNDGEICEVSANLEGTIKTVEEPEESKLGFVSEVITSLDKPQEKDLMGREKKIWNLESIKTRQNTIAAVLYNLENGQYIVAVKKDGDTKITEGESTLGMTASLNANVANYTWSGTASMGMGRTSHPPSIALIDQGIVIAEGKALRIVDYNMKEIQRYTQGSDDFGFVNKYNPFSMVAGGGNAFGLYANFTVPIGKRKSINTPPMFLLFGLDKKQDIEFFGALDTKEMPMNVATGIAISEEGYLALSTTGGRVYVDDLFEKTSARRYVNMGGLDVYKLEISGRNLLGSGEKK